jgi:hypothetical protein
MSISKETGGDTLRETGEIPMSVKATIAMRFAVAKVIDEHLRTGHPLIIWRDGKVYRQPPEEASRELEEAMKDDPWTSVVASRR